MVPLQSINIRSPILKLFKIVVICWLAVILFPVDVQAQSNVGTLFYYAQGSSMAIQDNGGYEGRTIWEINLTGAPADAVIKAVDVEYWITHTWVGDLKVWLTTQDKGEWVDYVLWNRQGESTHDIHEKETSITTWNGLPVNRKWYLCAADYVRQDEGKIDSWKIWVYFDNAAVGSQSVPFFEDFTEGKPDRSEGWEYYSNNEGRIEVVDGKLRMDDRQDASQHSLNEAILHIDLSERSGVLLNLDHVNSNDENTGLPSTFTGHLNGDGIAISNDGTNWYLVTNLTTSFQNKSFDLDAVIQAAGISYTSDFLIKFQQYDNYAWSTDGRAFDNISVTTTGADPQSRKPFGKWKGTFNSTTYGVQGTINDWIMREDYTTDSKWELIIGQGTSIKINPSGTYSFNPVNDRLSFLYNGTASILNDGQAMQVPCVFDVKGTVLRSSAEGTYSLRLSPQNVPPIIDSGTWRVNRTANVALHVFR
jgi:subtilisin-like proprotein convertase family protein